MATHTIAYDVELRRPGCALVQASFGATVPAMELQLMADHWLLHPTDKMGLYEVTTEQLAALIEVTNHR